MPFANKAMVVEWIGNHPEEMATLLEGNVPQNLQDTLETYIRAKFQTPQALIVAYTAALAAIKGTGNTTFIAALNQAIAEQTAILEG